MIAESMIAEPLHVDSVFAQTKDRVKCCIPSVVHTIVRDQQEQCAKLEELQTLFSGCMVACWTLSEAGQCIATRLPHMAHVCDVDDDVKLLTLPYFILYLFGGIYVDASACLLRDVQPIFLLHPSSILFFFMASKEYLLENQLTFAVSAELIAAAPRIDAMHTLLDVLSRQISSGSYAVGVHIGILNQFVRATLNGSKNDAVVLLSEKYLYDEDELCNFMRGKPKPDVTDVALSSELSAILRAQMKNGNVTVMDAAPILAEIRTICDATNASFGCHEAIDVLILDTDFDEEKPVDASMDVAVQLHTNFAKLNAGAHVLLRKGCDDIAAAQLKMHGASETYADEKFGLWKVLES